LKLVRTSGEPDLDVACGTGRALLDYRKLDIDIQGVDSSPDMIAICHQKAERDGLQVRLFTERTQDLDLPHTYRTIIVPSSSFLHLTDRSDARRVLERFYHCLQPGGQLAMSMRTFDVEENEVDWQVVEEAELPGEGKLVRS
jgi:ubiquinone/menaquinone biosynthesis C-methylase UbiE